MNPTALLGSLQAGLFRAVALQVKAMAQFWHPTGAALGISRGWTPLDLQWTRGLLGAGCCSRAR